MAMQPPSGPAWWTAGREGTLAPWAQAVLWAVVKVDGARKLGLTDGEIGRLFLRSLQHTIANEPSKEEDRLEYEHLIVSCALISP